MILLGLFLASLTFGLNQLDPSNLTASLLTPSVGGVLTLSIVLLVILIQVEKRVNLPMLPAHLFNRRQLRLAYLLSAGAGLAEASLVFVPLMAVTGLASQGINEKNATWLLIPAIVAMAVGSPLAGRLLDRIGSRLVIMGGTALQTAGFLMLSLLGGNLIFFLLSGVLIGGGLTALLGAPIRYIMLGEASAEERSLAQGLVTLFTSIGQLVGSALIGALVASFGSVNPFNGYQTAFGLITITSLILFVSASLLKTRQRELETLSGHEAFSRG
jgi:MFS family permease